MLRCEIYIDLVYQSSVKKKTGGFFKSGMMLLNTATEVSERIVEAIFYMSVSARVEIYNQSRKIFFLEEHLSR